MQAAAVRTSHPSFAPKVMGSKRIQQRLLLHHKLYQFSGTAGSNHSLFSTNRAGRRNRSSLPVTLSISISTHPSQLLQISKHISRKIHHGNTIGGGSTGTHPQNAADVTTQLAAASSGSIDIKDNAEDRPVAKEDMQQQQRQPQRPNISMMKYMKAYSELGKLKLSSLVVATTAAGYIAAGPIPLGNLSTFTAAIVGTSLCSLSASAYNQIYEISRDTKMKRTQLRPLVTGIISPMNATIIATMWGGCGTSVLYYFTDPVTTTLGVGNIILYSCIYTTLKPISIYNTWIGAIVGAIPPIMGYTAAIAIMNTGGTSGTVTLPESTNSAFVDVTDVVVAITTSALPIEIVSSLASDPIAITLMSTLYLWQLPHFMALSYMYRIDYKRGGFMMVPTAVVSSSASKTNGDELSEQDLGSTDTTVHTDTAGVRTSNIIVRYAWYLSMVPIFATVMDVTSTMYLLESIVLNSYALHMAYKFHHQQTNQNARTVFLTSLWYLPCTLMLFLLHSKTWDSKTEEQTTGTTNKNALAQFVSEQIHTIRNKGRELCIHEQAIVKNSAAMNATPGTISNNGKLNSFYNREKDEFGSSHSEAACPVMIVRQTDPNNIHINHQPASMAAHPRPSPAATTDE